MASRKQAEDDLMEYMLDNGWTKDQIIEQLLGSIPVASLKTILRELKAMDSQ